MKKIFFVLALVASMQFAGAQTKSVGVAKSAVEAAKAAVDNVKKNTKSATWIKYGQTLLDAYNAPAGNFWTGMTQNDIKLLGGGEKALSEEQVEINGQPMTKQIFDNKELYFDQTGKLSIINVTKPVVDDALTKALDAFKKAGEIDGGQKTKDISAGIKAVADKFIEEAYNAYSFGKYNDASKGFENAYLAAATAPYSVLDTNSVYNAGFTALLGEDLERARTLFQKSLDYGYAGEGGEAYAKLSDIAEKLGDKEASKSYLEEGFSKFPQSQSILVGLINYYVSSGEDTDRLFELLNDAKLNEPGNASLYYVEGNIHSKLGNEEGAIHAYDMCSEIDPSYVYGYIGKGLYYYNKAADIQTAANLENDDAKYMALIADFEKYLKACVEPLETAYDKCKDEEVKGSLASYLKSTCFLLRGEEEYSAKYDKYNAIAQ